MRCVRRAIRQAVGAAGLLFACATTADAVITYGDPGRLTAPDASSIAYPAWQLQGQFSNGRLFTPIGPNLILFAKHVFYQPSGPTTPLGAAYPVYFGGQTFTLDPSYNNGLGVYLDPASDMGVFRINETFPAYAELYPEGSSDILGNKPALVFGSGTQRGDPVYVNSTLKGWNWGATDNVRSWGQNNVAGYSTDPTYSNGAILMAFSFDAAGGANEATVSAGDSSGGVFIQSGGVWKVAGVVSYVNYWYRTTSNGTDFPASIFDGSGLYTSSGAASGPQYWFATRVASEYAFLNTVMPYTSTNNAVIMTDQDFGDVTVTNTLHINSGYRLQASKVIASTLEISSGARVVIEKSGTPNGTSKINALTIAATGKFDIADNALIVQSNGGNFDTLAAQINAYIASGRIGAWTGYGLTSSTITSNMTLAVIPNRNSAGNPIMNSFGGVSVDANSILVKQARLGDLNFDTRIDIDDFFLMDVGYAQGGGTYWKGDLNYSGAIDGDDYFLIDAQFLTASALGIDSPTPVAAVGNGGAVPEPGTLALAALGALSLLRRHRKA